MTNDELDRINRIERNLEFIAEHQARFESHRQQMEEQQRRTEANLDRTEANLDRLTIQHAAREDVVMKLAQSHVQLVDSHRRLAEAQAHTDERLDAFIIFVEKYISGRNGGQQSTS